MIRYALVLDSGACWATFGTREEAKAAKDRHNRMAREQKERGDMVSLRYCVGIARYDTEALIAAERAKHEAARKRRDAERKARRKAKRAAA